MMAKFIVLRSCPPEWRDKEGRWLDFDSLSTFSVGEGDAKFKLGSSITFAPMGRFESDCGRRAEIYEPVEGEAEHG